MQLNFQLDSKKTILVAPLHWGLGHATRCIPIIYSLLANNYNVLLGSDGAALLLLRKEFPSLNYIELPSYRITYAKNGRFLKWKLLFQLPHIQKTITTEKKIIRHLVNTQQIQGCISDNRWGVYNTKIPSVYITHQVQVLSGITTYVSSKLHQKSFKNFIECWVPDVAKTKNLSGKLGHLAASNIPLKYIGPLSRMASKPLPKKFDITCILSGPEPQRSIFENQLRAICKETDKQIALVQGVIEDEETVCTDNNLTVYNFLETTRLETLINESALLVSRSGYTSIMDFAIMNKPVFFIPTPGQFEQEYLAKYLKEQGIAPSCTQAEFTLDKLKSIRDYTGFRGFSPRKDYSELFRLFEGK